MLKHHETINKLTLKQKLAYLASGNMPEEVCAVPPLDISFLKDINLKDGAACPSLNGIANCWEPELFEKLGGYLGAKAKKEGANIGLTPDLSFSMHPYKPALSEDPYLFGALAAGFAKGVGSTGIVPIISNCSLNDNDAAFMDIFPDNRIYRDYIIRPFETAFYASQAGGVVVSDTKLSGKYQDANLKLTEMLKNGRIQTLSQPQNPDEAATGLRAGNILLLGDVKPLEDAHNNYLNYKESLESGKITFSEFEELMKKTAVLSEYDLDTAVDRLLEFAFKCHSRAEISSAPASLISSVPLETQNGENTDSDFKKLYQEAAERSIVLLKNKLKLPLLKNSDKILPLDLGTRVAVIGPSASKIVEILKQKENQPFECVGYAEGYNLNGERNDAALGEAVSLTYSSSAALLVLESDPNAPEQKKSLSANRLALIDALCKTGRSVIAVITGEYTPDVSFDNDCSAVLYMPCGSAANFDTLLKTLSGEINPSGKLSFTLYDDTDEVFNEIKKRKDLGRNKIGPFFGYRGYDSAWKKVKYPFGHGLSYTDFSYSKLKAGARGVDFVLTNTGTRAGYETVQVYVAKKVSDIVRPLKELKGFKKIYLAPGESKAVSIDFNYEDLKVCDPGDGLRKAENGEYTAFVGASVSDIRLVKSFSVQGEKLVGKKESLSDYIDKESNIANGRYVLEEVRENKKKSIIARIVSIVAILAAGVFDIFFGVSVANGSEFNPVPTVIILILLNLLVPAAITVLIVDAKKRKKIRLAAKQAVLPENETEISGRPALEKLFLEEFTETVPQQKQTVFTDEKKTDLVKETDTVQPDDSINPFTDNSLTLKTAAGQLAAFISERGITAEPSAIRTFISAMYSSRVIVLSGANSGESKEFIKHLCSYFGTQEYSDFVSLYAGNTEQDGVINRNIESGAALKAISDANQNRRLMHFAVIKDFDFPKAEQPRNLWYIYLPYAGALDCVPRELAETAAVIDLRLRRTAEKNEKTIVLGPDIVQFLKLSENSEKACTAGENLWKKLDKIEEYTNSRTPFKISNKQWRGIEKYVSVYLACDTVETEAADSVVCVKLLPHILPLIKSGLGAGGDFSITLENIMGEGNASLSLSALKQYRNNTERRE